MDEERRRPRKLTPMSGELRAPVDWTPPGPVDERYKPKREKKLPRTTKEVIVAGLRRLLVTLAVIAGVTALACFLLIEFAGTEVERTFTLGYFLVGAALLAVGFMHQTGTESEWYRDRDEHELAFNWSVVYALFGVLMIAIGTGLEFFL